jgi:hypothetical protein
MRKASLREAGVASCPPPGRTMRALHPWFLDEPFVWILNSSRFTAACAPTTRHSGCSF